MWVYIGDVIDENRYHNKLKGFLEIRGACVNLVKVTSAHFLGKCQRQIISMKTELNNAVNNTHI